MRTGNLAANPLSILEDPGATEHYLGCAHGSQNAKLQARFCSQDVLAPHAAGTSHLLMHVLAEVLQNYSSPCL